MLVLNKITEISLECVDVDTEVVRTWNVVSPLLC